MKKFYDLVKENISCVVTVVSFFVFLGQIFSWMLYV